MFRVMDKGVCGHGHNRVSSETLTNLFIVFCSSVQLVRGHTGLGEGRR